ncbi:hypothetical protein TWF132_002376 [Orbilia oligospora]|nr:hypothetical protein TWF132_002376 [Orbilia oligospora]
MTNLLPLALGVLDTPVHRVLSIHLLKAPVLIIPDQKVIPTMVSQKDPATLQIQILRVVPDTLPQVVQSILLRKVLVETLYQVLDILPQRVLDITTITPSDSASNYERSEISRVSHRASSSSAQYTTTESSRRSSRPSESSRYTPSESSRASRKTPPSSSSGSRAPYGSSSNPTPAPPGSVTGSHKNARRYGDKPFGTAESRHFEDPYGTDVRPTQPSSSSRSHHSSSSRRH